MIVCSKHAFTWTWPTECPQLYLSEIQINEAECEELQTDGQTVEQPVDCHGQVVGLQCIVEVEREQCGAQSSPEQAEEQEDTLVAPSFVSVEVEEPQLDVHQQEECSVQSGVQDGEAQLDRRGHSRAEGNGGR